MKRSSLCSATIVHMASCLGRPVSGRAMQYSNAVPSQPGFFCTPEHQTRASGSDLEHLKTCRASPSKISEHRPAPIRLIRNGVVQSRCPSPSCTFQNAAYRHVRVRHLRQQVDILASTVIVGQRGICCRSCYALGHMSITVVGAAHVMSYLLRLDAGHHPVRLAAVVAVDVVKDDPQARHDEAHAEGNEDEHAAGDRCGRASLDQICERGMIFSVCKSLSTLANLSR